MTKITFALSFVVALLVGWLIWITVHVNEQPKIAYIKSLYLVENYEGTKEAYQVLQKQVVEWEAKLDSLKNIYREVAVRYKTTNTSLSDDLKGKLEQELLYKQQNLEKYQNTIVNQKADKDRKLTEGIYAQIDTYLKEYAESKGYDLVIGANKEGSLLYGSTAYDITDEVLVLVNEKYKGL